MFEPAVTMVAAREATLVLADPLAQFRTAAAAPAQKVAESRAERSGTGLQDGFQIPPGIWLAMFACYGIFFLAIAAATAWSGHARFAIAISLLYTAMYFGVARVLAAIGGPERPSPLLRRSGVLQTSSGPMDYHAVAGQILAVPFGLALFGVAIALIRAMVG